MGGDGLQGIDVPVIDTAEKAAVKGLDDNGFGALACQSN